MDTPPRKILPYYLTPGSKITIHHVQFGDLCATILPFSASINSTAQVILVELQSVPYDCSLQSNTPYIVKIFDPRFMRGEETPWAPENEAAAARLHNGDIQFNPKECPDMGEADYDEDVVQWELTKFQSVTWKHHNECLAYRFLSPLQGSCVPVFHGAGQLDLSGTAPPRAIQPFVLITEYIQDAVSLEAIDARRLTEQLMRALVDNAELLKQHGVIHTDANEANFLLVPAHSPTRVVVIDFAECWTRDAAKDEQDWRGALQEWNPAHDRKAALNWKLEDAGLPIPDVIALPRFEPPQAV